jgi:hypothetical protein
MFWWKNVRERDHLEELKVEWRIKLKWIFKKEFGVRGMD